MSRHHDIGSRYEEPDFHNEDTAKCCKCSEHFDIEMMVTKDCIEFVCSECKRDADEAAGDAKRAEQKDETMNTPTDKQLRQTLATMLPEKVYIRECMPMCGETTVGAVRDQDGSWRYHSNEWHLYWITEEQSYERDEVLDTELLHLCWLVEEQLSVATGCIYVRLLWKQVARYDTVAFTEDAAFLLSHATWQQRTLALAKTLGIPHVQERKTK